MITDKKSRLLIFLGASILSLSVNLTSVLAASGIILIRGTGTVEVKSPQPDAWKPVSSGAVLSFGDVIRTGPQSKAEISFESGIIRMNENTILEIPSKFQQVPVSEGAEKLKNVFLVKGRSLFQVFKNRLQNGFEVTTPTIIAGVKGTTFIVWEEPDSKGVNVTEGTVIVTNRRYPMESMEVTSGHFSMLKDEHLAAPREFRDQNDLRLQEKRLKDARVKDANVKDVKEMNSQANRKDRLSDLRDDAQDRTGTGGFTLPGKNGNMAAGLGNGNSGSGSVNNGNHGSGNNGNHGSGNNGNGNGGNSGPD